MVFQTSLTEFDRLPKWRILDFGQQDWANRRKVKRPKSGELPKMDFGSVGGNWRKKQEIASPQNGRVRILLRGYGEEKLGKRAEN
jgi:hypothetical protein